MASNGARIHSGRVGHTATSVVTYPPSTWQTLRAQAQTLEHVHDTIFTFYTADGQMYANSSRVWIHYTRYEWLSISTQDEFQWTCRWRVHLQRYIHRSKIHIHFAAVYCRTCALRRYLGDRDRECRRFACRTAA